MSGLCANLDQFQPTNAFGQYICQSTDITSSASCSPLVGDYFYSENQYRCTNFIDDSFEVSQGWSLADVNASCATVDNSNFYGISCEDSGYTRSQFGFNCFFYTYNDLNHLNSYVKQCCADALPYCVCDEANPNDYCYTSDVGPDFSREALICKNGKDQFINSYLFELQNDDSVNMFYGGSVSFSFDYSYDHDYSYSDSPGTCQDWANAFVAFGVRDCDDFDVVSFPFDVNLFYEDLATTCCEDGIPACGDDNGDGDNGDGDNDNDNNEDGNDDDNVEDVSGALSSKSYNAIFLLMTVTTAFALQIIYS